MAYVASGFTPDQEGLLLERQAVTADRVSEIVERQKREERNRQITVAIAAAGAFFAAVRLGIIFAPAIRRRKEST